MDDILVGPDMSEQTNRERPSSESIEQGIKSGGLPAPAPRSTRTKIFIAVAVVAILVIAIAAGIYLYRMVSSEPEKMVLATTTSTYDSGLLDYLMPKFDSSHNVKTKIISVGTGQAIEYGRRGDADVLLVHSKAQEEAFVNEGKGLWRKDVMYNWFIIVGPKNDPAQISGMNDTVAAFKAIYNASATFCTRGDLSGTNTKELALWKKAGLSPDPRMASWYLNLSQGMGETLTTCNEKKAYTLSDTATWWSMVDNLGNLDILLEGDRANLLNQYGVIPVNGSNGPHVRTDLGIQFASWITGPEGQSLIANYTRHDQQLFFPNAS